MKPHGFSITENAIKFHNISNEDAAGGMNLTALLKEFMTNVKVAGGKGARIRAHDLEFDAGVIYEESGRCNLLELRKEWSHFDKCVYYRTMNPNACRWILDCRHRDVGPMTKKYVLGLDTIARIKGFF